MIAILLAPFYILVNLYVVNWMFQWMGTCNFLFRTLAFRAVFSGFYIFLATAVLTGFLIKKPSQLHRSLKNTGNYFLGMFLYILMVIAFVDCGRIILKNFFHVSWIRSGAAFVISGLLCAVLIIIISIYGILHVRTFKTTSYEITVRKAVEDMDSLKIVLIADTHFGYSVGHKHAEMLANAINAEKPDLICIAGDIFDNEFDAVEYPEKLKDNLSSLQAEYGVYACWGNHDLNEPILAGFTFKNPKQDKNDPRMELFLKDCGIRLLNDESTLIDNKFYLVGRKDLSRTEKIDTEIEKRRLTPAQLTSELDHTKPIFFLDHQPKELQEIAEAGADLDLCGHTHNGQMFPGNLLLHLFWENPCGYLRKGSMHNIVTSGAGIWGPNMRVGTDNEICVITVKFNN
ncbi:MAG: metallophosphoesterase [Eubacteriales bacterium]|nr:metallophosphoesterase [Eubacteriales bacterium]